jgi:ATP sulfurylase
VDTQDDDIPGTVRYQTYEVLKKETANPKIVWAYLPYSMHMAGPREAIQHMLIRKNYGCTHFIIGRDMAGSKSCLDGEDFYGAYDAQVRTQQRLWVGVVVCVARHLALPAAPLIRWFGSSTALLG